MLFFPTQQTNAVQFQLLLNLISNPETIFWFPLNPQLFLVIYCFDEWQNCIVKKAHL